MDHEDSERPLDPAPDAETLAKIAHLAHTYWEAEGRPEGRDLEHWLRAEADVRALLESGGAGDP